MSLEDEIKKLTVAITELTNQIKIYKIPERSSLEEINSGRLLPIRAWPKYHDWPNESGLRYLIFYEKTNGASAWIRRVGKRVLIDEDAFFEWAKTNPQK